MADHTVHSRAHDLLPDLKLNAAGEIFVLAQKLGKAHIRGKKHDAADCTQPCGNCRPAEAEVKRAQQEACGKDERRDHEYAPLLRLRFPCVQALCEQFGIYSKQDKAEDEGRDEEHAEQPPRSGKVKRPGGQEEEQPNSHRSADELHDALNGKLFPHIEHLPISKLYPCRGRWIMREQHRSAFGVKPQGL